MGDGQEWTVDSARDAAGRDELGDWVARFLGSPGSDNAELGQQLSQRPSYWIGPVRVPLDRLNRLAGPPGEPVLVPLDDDDWGDDVEEMEEKVEEEGWEPPPVIVTHRDGQLLLEDGNHRVESLRRAGKRETWAVINFPDAEARDRFS
jgi:ParB-like nuclease domain